MEDLSSSKPKVRDLFAAGCVVLACFSLLLMGSHGGGLLPAHAQAMDPSPPSEVVKLIFIHHSCGENWLADGDGGLGIALRDSSYFVSDTNYGWGPGSIGDNTGDLSGGTGLETAYRQNGQHAEAEPC